MLRGEMKIKEIPYGMSNFKSIIVEDKLYIDKTRFIELIERKSKFLSFLRPRRFGKSLFISTLWYYYDEYYSDIRENLFKETYIGKNPTELKSSYRILFLEFSGISTDNIQLLYKSFVDSVKSKLRGYLSKYNYSDKYINYITSLKTPEGLLKEFFEIVKNDKIYLLIDEYDNFANALLGESLESFQKILQKGGFLRSFYEVIKSATQTGIIDRLFLTGVTPITLDSMTSGFNIIKDITIDKEFNELAGFTLEETKYALNYIFYKCPNINRNNLISDITNLYNGYKFNSEAKYKVFNSTMVLYFISEFNTESCKYPKELLDFNVASDYKKIMQLFSIGDLESNYQVLKELIETNKTIANLKPKIEFDKGFYRDDFVTILYSMGFITIKDEILNKMVFTIPNYTIRTLYFDYFKVELENRSEFKFNTLNIENALIEMALNNNIIPFQKEAKNIINLLSNRDYIKFEEKHLKVILLTILNIAKFYYIKSEPEYNNKYPDIMLLKQEPFEVKHQYLFELKRVKKDNKDFESKKKEGINQIKEYLKLEEIKKLKNLHSYLIISNGNDLDIIEVK